MWPPSDMGVSPMHSIFHSLTGILRSHGRDGRVTGHIATGSAGCRAASFPREPGLQSPSARGPLDLTGEATGLANRDRFTVEALSEVDRFIAGHGDLTRRDVAQPGQGSTNRVIFARRGGDLVVFKVFCEADRKQRECFALRHWGATGLVPELLWDAGPRMIVMSHVPGGWLADARRVDGRRAWADASRDAGRAAGSLTRVPLSSRDRASFESRFHPETPTLESYLDRILRLARCIHDRDPDLRYTCRAAEVLASIPRAVPALIRGLGSDQEMVRIGCVRAMPTDQATAKRVVPHVKALLARSASRQEQELVVEKLHQLGPDWVRRAAGGPNARGRWPPRHWHSVAGAVAAAAKAESAKSGE